MIALPTGFTARTANFGIKDTSPDFVVVVGEPGTVGASLYTKSRFAGASVVLSRELAAHGNTRAVVVLSKNSNVATGDEGLRNAREIVDHGHVISSGRRFPSGARTEFHQEPPR